MHLDDLGSFSFQEADVPGTNGDVNPVLILGPGFVIAGPDYISGSARGLTTREPGTCQDNQQGENLLHQVVTIH